MPWCVMNRSSVDSSFLSFLSRQSSNALSIPPCAPQPGLPDIKKQEIQANLKKPLNRRQTTEDSEPDLDDDVHMQQGRIETKKGVEVRKEDADNGFI